MAISFVNLSQQLSANVTSSGIQSNIPVGGTNTITLSSDDADYMYEFTIDSGHADNQISWNLATNQLSDTGSGTDAYVSQPLGGTMRDANDDAVQVAGADDDKVVAIYYETEAANTGTVEIRGPNEFGDLDLKSGDGTTAGKRVPRSALIVPRWETATGTITFDFSAAGDKIHVVFLGKT